MLCVPVSLVAEIVQRNYKWVDPSMTVLHSHTPLLVCGALITQCWDVYCR